MMFSDEALSIRHVVADSGLPALTGSPDQIAWAQTIRLDLLLSADTVLARLYREARNAELYPLRRMITASLRLRDVTPAAWWIASRNREMVALMQEMSHRSYALEFGEN